MTKTLANMGEQAMARLTTTLLMATALVATAACSKKRPDVLPPAPGGAPVSDLHGRRYVVVLSIYRTRR